MRRVAVPGLYLMTAADYHSDPAPEPSLSASLITTMLQQSPAHAWLQHPRLNPHYRPSQASADMDEGTILHFLLLGAGEGPAIVDADDWRTAAAQRLRATAHSQGRPAILLRRWRELKRAAAAIRRECRATIGAPDGIDQGIPEAVLVWQEGSTWCRCMIDWLPMGVPHMPPLIDFKTTGRAASAEQFARTAADFGHDVKAAWYRRGFQAVFGRPAGPMVFIACEKEAPWGVSRLVLGASFEELGESKVEEALEVWRVCSNRQDWPCYPRRVGTVEAPRWASTAWEDRAVRSGQQLKDGSRRVDPAAIARAQRLFGQLGGPVA